MAVAALLASALEQINEFGKLLFLLGLVTACDGFGDAAGGVILQHLAFDLGKSRPDRGDLVQDIDAVAIVLDHLRNAANLPGDAVQSLYLSITAHIVRPVEIPWGGI